jgi:hypothetical protein
MKLKDRTIITVLNFLLSIEYKKINEKAMYSMKVNQLW